MPKTATGVYCINHSSTQMIRNPGFNAVIKLSKQGGNSNFHLDSGVPTALFICPTCGYIEMYAGMSDPSWNQPNIS
jgi:hypothetical protein